MKANLNQLTCRFAIVNFFGHVLSFVCGFSKKNAHEQQKDNYSFSFWSFWLDLKTNWVIFSFKNLLPALECPPSFFEQVWSLREKERCHSNSSNQFKIVKIWLSILWFLCFSTNKKKVFQLLASLFQLLAPLFQKSALLFQINWTLLSQSDVRNFCKCIISR